MPNINKVVFGSATLIDLTTSTLSSADQIVSGTTAYDRGGNLLNGTAVIPPDGDELGYGTERLTDLTGTSWRWNNTIEGSSIINTGYEDEITSGNRTLNGIYYTPINGAGYSWEKTNALYYLISLGHNSTLIYSDQDGMNTTYQEFTIVSMVNATDPAVIAFVQANATQITS